MFGESLPFSCVRGARRVCTFNRVQIVFRAHADLMSSRVIRGRDARVLSPRLHYMRGAGKTRTSRTAHHHHRASDALDDLSRARACVCVYVNWKYTMAPAVCKEKSKHLSLYICGNLVPRVSC